MIRQATSDDIPSLKDLIRQSCRVLLKDVFSEEVIEAYLSKGLLALDENLINDKTLYCITDNNQIVACGGWSKRKKNLLKSIDAELDSSEKFRNTAMLRNFYVKPEFARRGYGKKLLSHCEREAKKDGISKIELIATPLGAKLYNSNGFFLEDIYDFTIEGTDLKTIYLKMYKYI